VGWQCGLWCVLGSVRRSPSPFRWGVAVPGVASAVEDAADPARGVAAEDLVVAIVLAKVDDGSLDKKTFNGWLAPAITRAEDRALFWIPHEQRRSVFLS